MVSCIPSNEDLIHEMNPKVLLTNPSEIEPILIAYKEKDSVSNVKTSIATILENKTQKFQYITLYKYLLRRPERVYSYR